MCFGKQNQTLEHTTASYMSLYLVNKHAGKHRMFKKMQEEIWKASSYIRQIAVDEDSSREQIKNWPRMWVVVLV